MPNLERLELGFNLIKRIEGLGHLPKVRHLELNNNLIYRLDDASALQKCVPKVQELNLHNNAVCELKGYRTHVLRKLNELTVLDGITVETGERESASDTSRSITVDLLKTHGHSRRRPVSSFGRGARSQEHPETQSSIEARSPNDLVRGGGDDGRWWDEIEELDLDHFHLRKLHDLERLVHLRRASFCNNELMRIEGLENCVHLQELSLEDNKITKLENVDALVRLTKLELGKNRITRIEGLETLTALTQLSLEDNEISSLTGLSSLTSLMELYIGNNRIAELKEVQQLRTLPKLIILDISGNELCRTTDSRSYVIFHLRKLKVLDGIGIDLREMNIAKERFAGRLTQEALVERLGHSYFEHVLELDLSRSKIRELEALHAYAPSFCNMRELNLDLNLIADGGAIPFLPALTVLRLNHNQISTIPLPPASGSWKGIICLAALEVLQLGFNQIVDIPSLHVNRLPNLKVLHLQGNEITRVEGLTDMPQLRELILDRNKIKALDAQSISSLSSLRELRIEENGLRTLEYVANLPHLTTLAIGTNRIADIPELEKLDGLPSLQHLALANNGVARKQLYRPTLVRQLPSLRLIDAREVTHEERERAEIIFNADARPNIASADPTTTRGFATKVPLKLTSMNFEMMAGLGGGPGGGLGGGLGIASIGAPGDIRGNPPHGFGNQRSDRNLHGESASADWHPISGGHDNFFHQQGRGRGLGRSVGSGRTAGSSTDRRPYR
uniref:U2A'/phosphoprotein 32 family A C-terminal domain-containing protein n=1 Tax=Strombidinopsis acuminata TaxID=141414 RepID=A0A7S3SJ09_9SPIT